MTKYILLTLILLLGNIPSYSNAEMQILSLPNSIGFGAVIPCKTKKRSVNSAVGVTNALQCAVDNGVSACIFAISEQPLDVASFNKSGFKFIEEVHLQYALQLDRDYKSIKQNVVNMGTLGRVLNYEITRTQEGVKLNVRGSWMVSNGRMLRGAVSCTVNSAGFMKNESELFLNSFVIIKNS